jgi:hypothetical protein
MNDAYSSYWAKFLDAKITEEYYFLYIHQSKVFLWVINVICMATSFTGLIALIKDYLPNLVSSIIILLPQLISLFQPFYPFGDRLYAAIRKSPESHRFLCFSTALLLLFIVIKTPVLNENRRSFTD